MLLFLILTNLLTGFILTVYAFFSTAKEHKSKLIDTFLLTFFLPSLGFGLWSFGRKELEKEKNLQVLSYYIFNKMGIVHILFIAVFFILLLMDLYLLGGSDFSELFFVAFLFFIFSIVYFIFFFLIVLIAILAPFLIANMIHKKKVLDTLDEDIIDMEKWERATPPIDKKDLSYQVDDEYISLADDDDDEIIIDLD